MMLALLFFFQGLARADFSLSGEAYSFLYAPLEKSEILQSSVAVWPVGTANLGENTQLKFQLAAAYHSVLPGGAKQKFDMDLREGYLKREIVGWSFQAGKQITPLGNSEGYYPTDFLGSRDLTFFASDSELNRLGNTAVKVKFIPDAGNSRFSLTGIVVPYFTPSRLFLPAGTIPAGFALGAQPVLPRADGSNIEELLVSSFYGDGWDISLLGFHGLSRTPELKLTAIHPTGVDLDQAFHEIYGVGMYGSATWDAWIFRAESAYKKTQVENGTPVLLPPANLDTVIGVERPIGDRFRILGQVVWKHLLDEQPIVGTTVAETAALQAIYQANSLLLNYPVKDRVGATGRITYTPSSQDFEIELFGTYYFAQQDYLLRPKFKYQVTQNLNWILGVSYFGGKKDTPFGLLNEYSAAFTELAMYF